MPFLVVTDPIHRHQGNKAVGLPGSSTAVDCTSLGNVIDSEPSVAGAGGKIGLLRVQEEPIVIPPADGSIAARRYQHGGAPAPVQSVTITVGVVVADDLAEPARSSAQPIP
jgi:hypothetical protein